MSESTKRGLDGLDSVSTVTTQLIQALLVLVLMYSVASALSGREAGRVHRAAVLCQSELAVTLPISTNSDACW